MNEIEKAEANDARLLSIAAARMNNFDPSTLVSQEAFDAEFGITKESLSEIEGIEFE